MDRRIQLICAWCGPVFLVGLMVGLWFIGGLIPPPSANDSAEHIARFYQQAHHHILWGMLICMIFAPLTIPFQCCITYQLKRANPAFTPFAYTQLVAGMFVTMVFFLSIILITVCAFRPFRDPAVTQGINDVAFITFVWPFSFVMMEYLPVGLAVLLDKSERPVYPKWVGVFELIIAAMFIPAAPLIFTHHGAFSWQGFWPFWFGFAAFGAWFAVMFAMMLRNISSQTEESLAAGAA